MNYLIQTLSNLIPIEKNLQADLSKKTKIFSIKKNKF